MLSFTVGKEVDEMVIGVFTEDEEDVYAIHVSTKINKLAKTYSVNVDPEWDEELRCSCPLSEVFPRGHGFEFKIDGNERIKDVNLSLFVDEDRATITVW